MKTLIFTLFYIVIPLGVLAHALSRFFRRRGAYRALSLAGAGMMGMFFGGCVAWAYGWVLGGVVSQGDLFITLMVGMATAWMFKGIDWSTESLLLKTLGRRRGWPWRILLFFGAITRMIVMVAFCLVWIGGMLLVYRVPVHGPVIPDELAEDRIPATLSTRDGIKLSAWYFTPETPSTRSALICPGFGSRKDLHIDLVERLLNRGWNVLVFDARAQGESAGYCQSFGADEKYDVLAAVEWLKENHPDESQKIVGIGVNTGAAALMLAAADPAGLEIDSLALVEPYDSWPNTLNDAGARFLFKGGEKWVPFALNWIGSLHAGAMLQSLNPGDSAQRIWPRPVLVIHGRGFGITPPLQEIDVVRKMGNVSECWVSDGYIQMRDALKNKKPQEQIRLVFRRWIGIENSAFDDGHAQSTLLDFIENAKSNPVL